MAAKTTYKTTFEVGRVINPLYTGGPVALSKNGSLLITALGGDAVLTDITTGKHITTIQGDGEILTGLALTPDSAWLILCSRSLSMRIFFLTRDDDGVIEPVLKRTIQPHSAPVSVTAVDRTGTLLATGGKDGVTKVWDIVKGYQTHNFQGPATLVSSLHFFEPSTSNQPVARGVSAPNDNPTLLLAVGCQDGKIRVFDLYGNSTRAKLDSHVAGVQALEYSRDQNILMSASRDKTVIWWDTRTWKIRKIQPVFEMVEAAGLVANGRITFSAGSSGCLRYWETTTGRELTNEREARTEEHAIIAGLYCSLRDFILCVRVDHTLDLYQAPEIPANGSIATLPSPEPYRWISGTHDEIIDMAYLSRDKSAMALATNSEDIRIVSIADSEEAYFGQDLGVLRGHDQIVISLDVDWSGHWVLTGAKDNTAKLWKVDVAAGEYTCYATYEGHTKSVTAVALPRTTPVESSAAFRDPLNHPPPFILTGSEDQTIKRWEVLRDAPDLPARAIYTKIAHEKDINALDVDQAGQLFASASQDKTVKLWSVADGESRGVLKGHRRGVWAVRFAPSSTPQIQSGHHTGTWKGAVLTGSGDKTLKIWSLGDHSCLRTFEGHTHSILKVAWLSVPDGNAKNKRPLLCASAGGDGLVKIWNVDSGENECTLDNHEDRVWALAVHPETNTVVSGSADATVVFWEDVSSATQAAEAEAALKIVEQEQELQNHIRAGSYREAITLALQLNHPGRLLTILTSVVMTSPPDPGSLSGLSSVDDVLANLSDDQLFLLLLRLRDWNTNARTAPVAQKILWTLVRSYPASRFVNLSVRGATGARSMKEVIHGLEVYSDRHYKRMEDMLDESFFVEYTLQQMGSLLSTTPGRGNVNGTRKRIDSDGDVIMF